MNAESSQNDIDEEIVDRFQADLETQGSVILEKYIVQYPWLAGRFRDLVSVLEKLKDYLRKPLASGHELGEFRIVALLDGGGMGLIYEAVQQSLNRRVAVKVFWHGTADGEQFRREQQLMARFHHTHILAVHSAGKVNIDGRPVEYFAMPYVEKGAALSRVMLTAFELHTSAPGTQMPTLAVLAAKTAKDGKDKPAVPFRFRAGDDRADRRPDYASSEEIAGPVCSDSATARPKKLMLSSEYFRSVATAMIDVGQALHHVHEQGVVHRDVKPSNLLVGADGHCWLFDFGLAVDLNQNSGGGSQCELGSEQAPARAIQGTVPYMAPEQFRGSKASALTDIYALGVTLYELLTLQPAFHGRSHVETRAKICSEDPTPPRHLVHHIPADLESICQRTMRKDPADRYQTALEFTEDLRRYLKHEPISGARTFRRFRLWTKREPRLAAASVISVAFFCLAFGIQVWWMRNAETDRVKIAGKHQLLLDVLKESTQASEKLANEPRAEQHLRRMLEIPLKYYQRIGETDRNDPDVRHLTALAHSRWARMELLEGDLAAAQSAFNHAIALLMSLASDFPARPAYREHLAQCYNNLGLLLHDTSQSKQAEEMMLRSLELKQALVEEFPGEPAYRAEVADSSHNLGNILGATGRWQEAVDAYRRAVGMCEELALDFPNVMAYRKNLAGHHDSLGSLLRHTKAQEAEVHFRRAVKLQEDLVVAFSNEGAYRYDWAGRYTNLGSLLRETHRLEEGERYLRRALELQQRLVADFPAVRRYKERLAEVNHHLADLLREAHRFAEAEQGYGVAVDVFRELAKDLPHVPAHNSHLAVTLNNLAMMLAQKGRLTESRELLKEALTYQQYAFKASPQNPEYRKLLRDHWLNLAGISVGLGAHADAAKAAVEVPRIFPQECDEYVCAAVCLVRCAWLAEKDSKLPGGRSRELAQDYIDEAKGLLREAGLRAGEDPKALNHVAWVLATCPDQRLRDARQAVELAKKAVDMRPEKNAYWNTLGVALYYVGNWKEAIDALEKSTQLPDGGKISAWFFLAMANWRLGDEARSRRWYTRGIQAMQKKEVSDEEPRRFRDEAATLMGIDIESIPGGKHAPDFK